MAKKELSLLSIILEISEAVDLVNPQLADHHSRVAYIVSQLARTLGLDMASRKALAIAGAVHDIGVLSFEETRGLVKFEIEIRPEHGEIGYLYLKDFGPLADAANLIRSHHVYWEGGRGERDHGIVVPLASHLIHLADRIAVLIDSDQEILTQTESIRSRIAEQSNRMFVPRFVEAFLDLSAKEYFWLDATHPALEWQSAQELEWEAIALDGHEFTELARLFCRIVDFKSPFTAAHSSGVAASAGALAKIVGFSDAECRQLITAGYLHDIGKLSVPSEVLEKPGKLDAREFAVIRHHSYHTFQVLRRIGMDEKIRNWSAYHHEHLDGSGYPFHITAPDLTTGCRIMSVADVFTALVENRPYRAGLPRSEVTPILHSMVSKGWLDGGLIDSLFSNFEEVNTICLQAEDHAVQEYRRFVKARSDYQYSLPLSG